MCCLQLSRKKLLGNSKTEEAKSLLYVRITKYHTELSVYGSYLTAVKIRLQRGKMFRMNGLG
jgi:hypothetical protein